MSNNTPLSETLEAATESVQALTRALAGDRPTLGQRQDATRTEHRTAERAYIADGYRDNKTSIARTVANERGILPDARELFKIAQARQRLATGAARQAARARHPAGTKLAE